MAGSKWGTPLPSYLEDKDRFSVERDRHGEKVRITLDYANHTFITVTTSSANGSTLKVVFDERNIYTGGSSPDGTGTAKFRLAMPDVEQTDSHGTVLEFHYLSRVYEHTAKSIDTKLVGIGDLSLGDLAKRSELAVQGLLDAYEAANEGIEKGKITGGRALNIMRTLARAGIVEAMLVGQLLERKERGEALDEKGLRSLHRAHDGLAWHQTGSYQE